MKVAVSLGAYYSTIKSVKGREVIYDTADKSTSIGSFAGRSLRGLDDNGHVVSLTYIPGLQSFEKHDYGMILSCGYLLNVRKTQVIAIRVEESLGFQNINLLTDGNLPEKNHSVSLGLHIFFNKKIQRDDSVSSSWSKISQTGSSSTLKRLGTADAARMEQRLFLTVARLLKAFYARF